MELICRNSQKSWIIAKGGVFMEELCGFIPGKGLSHEKCVESEHKDVDPKIEENSNPACPNCGSLRRVKGEYNANCLDSEAGCDWKTIIFRCADCGADLTKLDPGGNRNLKVTEDLVKKFDGILNFLPKL
jgi:DNA-directed RNA polymerase subunit RPC12/RpoP